MGAFCSIVTSLLYKAFFVMSQRRSRMYSIVFFRAQQQCDLKLCKSLSFFRKLLSWVLFCAQQWQKSPNIDEYTQSSGTGGIHRWWQSMMIKKNAAAAAAAAVVRSIARRYHEIIRKPNLHEGKYSLEKKNTNQNKFLFWMMNLRSLNKFVGFLVDQTIFK